jgi:hypothetical protein
MSRIHPECLASGPFDRSVAADALLRQEPDEDEGEDNEGSDDDNENDAGYSE